MHLPSIVSSALQRIGFQPSGQTGSKDKAGNNEAALAGRVRPVTRDSVMNYSGNGWVVALGALFLAPGAAMAVHTMAAPSQACGSGTVNLGDVEVAYQTHPDGDKTHAAIYAPSTGHLLAFVSQDRQTDTATVGDMTDMTDVPAVRTFGMRNGQVEQTGGPGVELKPNDHSRLWAAESRLKHGSPFAAVHISNPGQPTPGAEEMAAKYGGVDIYIGRNPADRLTSMMAVIHTRDPEAAVDDPWPSTALAIGETTPTDGLDHDPNRMDIGWDFTTPKPPEGALWQDGCKPVEA